MKKKMLAVAVCVSMCMMAFAGCTSESGGGSDKKAEQTEGKKEEKDQQESAALNGSSCRPGCCRCGGRIRRITEKRGKGIMKEGVSGSSNLNPRHPLFNMFK